MNAEQIRKVIGWATFYVVLPLLVYPAAFFIAAFSGMAFSWDDLLVKGDVLFLVVVLLATTLDWTVIDFLLTPRSRAGDSWFDYLCFALLLIALVFYTMVYGWVITTRLSAAPFVANSRAVMWFSGASLLVWVVGCGVQYTRLVRRGRI